MDGILKKAAAGAQTISKKFGDVAGEATRGGIATARDAIGKMQRKLGEDYYAILEHNPLIENTFSRAHLLVEDKDLLGTAFNLPWMTTVFWLSAAGFTYARDRQIDHVLGRMFHYGPGHIARWTDVNSFMDSVAGSGHRLKFGHSIDFLPQIIERFGPEGVPAFFAHNLQDLFTPDGIPLVPHAWTIKQHLVATGLAHKTAASLVALHGSHLLAAAAVGAAVVKMMPKVKRERRRRTHLEAASEALQAHDFSGAIENYKRAIEVRDTPEVQIALGQAYIRRSATRPYAHHAFKKAMDDLATAPSGTLEHGGARISLRGVAGLQALSTVDVLGDRYPEVFDEQVANLVNGTVASFRRAAEQQEMEHEIPNAIVTPALLSAAINRFLAAQAACLYPLLDDFGRLVKLNAEAAVRNLGLVAQYDEIGLRGRIRQLQEIWAAAVLPQDEAELLLATV